MSQRLRDGRITVVDVPVPELRSGFALVGVQRSLISAGTERGKVELGGRSLVQKARARPDLVKRVAQHARNEGVRSAIGVVRERLDSPVPLGYSNAGVILRVAEGVEGFAPKDRVACAGAGFANHAEVVAVPQNLLAAIPPSVSFDDAAYATVGAIALHGVRRAEVEVGESIGVIGLGLVGQLAVQILLAAGARPFGVDFDPAAVELAVAAGANAFRRDDAALEVGVAAATGGLGLDAVLVCAASRTSDPIELGARLARDRGRIVVIGDVPIAADREVLYEKELEIRLSRSYGPGRYDRDYEERGRDLPPAYVRWTEGRNLRAFLELVAAGRLHPSALTTHRFPIERAEEAYVALTGDAEDVPRAFGIILEYSLEDLAPERLVRVPRVKPAASLGVGLIGTGAFARRTLIPALRASGAELIAAASETGLSAADAVTRLGFTHAATVEGLLANEDIQAVVVATRHGSHASLVAAALAAGKHVFVEKPLAIDEQGLRLVEEALPAGGILMVGFNRRFAPLTEQMRAALAGVPSPVLLARVNAGPLSSDHWLHDLEDGGGRLIGEGCHFVDLVLHLAGSHAMTAYAVAAPSPGRALAAADDVLGTLRLANGAIATVLYTGSGDSRLPKERIEAFGGGLCAVLDDFRRLDVYRAGKRSVMRGRQNKGHKAEIASFVGAALGREDPPSPESYLASTRATLALAESLKTGSPVTVG